LSTATHSLRGQSDQDYFGFSVGMAGDVNGDGLADLLIGASHWGGTRGAAYVIIP
jgi:hypothetical protein